MLYLKQSVCSSYIGQQNGVQNSYAGSQRKQSAISQIFQVICHLKYDTTLCDVPMVALNSQIMLSVAIELLQRVSPRAGGCTQVLCCCGCPAMESLAGEEAQTWLGQLLQTGLKPLIVAYTAWKMWLLTERE